MKLLPIIFYDSANRDRYNTFNADYILDLRSDDSIFDRLTEVFIEHCNQLRIDVPTISKEERNEKNGLYSNRTIYTGEITNNDIAHEFGHYLCSMDRDCDNHGLGGDFTNAGSNLIPKFSSNECDLNEAMAAVIGVSLLWEALGFPDVNADCSMLIFSEICNVNMWDNTNDKLYTAAIERLEMLFENKHFNTVVD